MEAQVKEFNMDITIDGNHIKLDLSDLATWTTWNWIWFGVICNAIYGYVTHLVSLPAMRKYGISNVMLVGSLMCRMTLQLPFRCLALVLGVIETILCFIAGFKLRLNNPRIKTAWRWHFAPEDLRRAWHYGDNII